MVAAMRNRPAEYQRRDYGHPRIAFGREPPIFSICDIIGGVVFVLVVVLLLAFLP